MSEEEHGQVSQYKDSRLNSQESRELINELNDLSEVAATPVDKEHPPVLKTPFIWPHENLALLRKEAKREVPIRGVFENLNWYLKNHRSAQGLERSNPVMRRINGPGSEFIIDKAKFLDEVEKMGYSIPRQVVVHPDKDLDAQQATISEIFPNPDQVVFIKTIGINGGNGVKIVRVGDSERILRSVDKDVVVQESVDIDSEYRYCIFQQGRNVWRFTYEKKRPSITGNGRSTLGALLEGINVPEITKVATMLHYRKRLSELIPAGESIQLFQFGSPKEGNFHSMPADDRLQNLDKFMAKFVGQLEARVGHKLPILAFDLAFKDGKSLDGPYNEDLIKENFFPVESQLPFGNMFYFRNVPEGKQVLFNFMRLMSKKI